MKTTNHPKTQTPAPAMRQRWMSAFARTPEPVLDGLMNDIGGNADFDLLRPPETGLVMTRGRAGGTGQQFNLGEMTVTRCSLRSAGGTVGHGYVAGRSRTHAETAAKLDVLLQELPETDARTITESLEREIAAQARARQQKSAPTRVEFFTMVRGEDE